MYCLSLSTHPFCLLLIFIITSSVVVDAFNTKNPMSTAKKLKLNNNIDCDGLTSSTSSLQPIRAGFIGCGTIASAIATSVAEPNHKSHLAQAGYILQSICVTRRSESKSTKLKENFGADVVTVYESADEVVANSDLIFLCILPQQVDSVLEDLKEKGVWRKDDHTLISLVVRSLYFLCVHMSFFSANYILYAVKYVVSISCAMCVYLSHVFFSAHYILQSTSNVEDLIQKTDLPRNEVYKMICLPAIAKREGCTLLQSAPAPAPTTSKDDNGESSNINVKSLLNALGGCVECSNDDIMNKMMVTTG